MTGKTYGANSEPRRGAVAPGRRPAAGHRRPRPDLAHAHRRRRDAVQRGPGLRAAADHAPVDPGDAAARLAGRAGAAGAACRSPGTACRRPTRSWPRTSAASPRTPTARRRRSSPRCKAGTTILDTAIAETKKARKKKLSGDKAFQLHDTYGFPIDLTLEIAAEAGLGVDQEGFRKLMAEQRQRAKADAAARKTGHADLSAYRSVLDAGGPVEFTGYAETARESKVRGLLGAGGTAIEVGRRGRRHRARARRDAVLRRGRRPAARHRPHHGRRRPDRGLRRPAVAARPDRAPGPGAARRGAGRARPGTARSTWSGAGRSLARTRRPTWCTRPCAASSASRRPRPVR